MFDYNGIKNDVYVVSGSITNTGNQTANNIRIIGTYYHVSGVVVAVGIAELKDPLAPNKSASFIVSEFDASPNLVTEISSYALLVQTSTQVFATPSPQATTSPADSVQLDSSGAPKQPMLPTSLTIRTSSFKLITMKSRKEQLHTITICIDVWLQSIFASSFLTP